MTGGHELLGTTIAGKYLLRRLVGLGGMGAVYEGEHVELGKRIAVKIIDTACAMSPELTLRFKREARAASAVESENIVQVFDVGSDPNLGLYMVMEFLDGEDLEMRLRKQPERRLDVFTAAGIGHQVARALVKAHGARVIHRDLKPANIFLTEREDGTMRVKVLDFGISKLLSPDAVASSTNKKDVLALTQEGVALGTPQYMSPEQAQGLTTIDHRTDIWSLGAVLFEAIAGQPAYPEMPTYEEVIMKILLERPPRLKDVAPWVPDAFAAIIDDAMQHDVSKRIPDCGAFARRLAAAIPEAMSGLTGPFTAARAMMVSYSAIAQSPPVTPPASPARVPSLAPSTTRTPAPSFVPSTGKSPPRSGPDSTSGAPASSFPAEDTQIVIRADADSSSEAYDEEVPSETMLAAQSASSRGNQLAHVVVRDRFPSSSDTAEDAPSAMSTVDPTMFQAPAWVGGAPPPLLEQHSPTTMKSGIAVRSLGEEGPPPSRGILAAVVTALAIVTVGVAVLVFVRRDGAPGAGEGATEPTEPSAPAASEAPASDWKAPAPPPTGTAEGLEGTRAPVLAPAPVDAARATPATAAKDDATASLDAGAPPLGAPPY